MTGISYVPKGWKIVSFGDLLMFAQNGCSTRHSRNSGVPVVVLRLADVSLSGEIETANLRSIAISGTDRRKYELKAGDLLAFRVNGSPSIAGQVVLYPGPAGYAFCDHFIRFRLREDIIDPKFATLAFRTPGVRRQIERKMISSAGQNTVSQKTYLTLEFPLPPVGEQRRIVSKLEEIQGASRRARSALESAARKLDIFEQSILTKAFLGELVPQNPSDEPASKLLERIHSEKRSQQNNLFEDT